MQNLELTSVLTMFLEWGAGVLPNFLAAIVLCIGGYWLARRIERSVAAVIDRDPRIDKTLKSVLSRTASYAILIVVFIAALGQLGIQTTSILAALGAAGLAIGLALQGTLSNIAAGIMLLWLRPFKIGDYIEAPNAAGSVEDVGLFATHLRTPDGIFSFVPNSELWNKQISNYSRNPTRRIRLQVGIAYDDDISKARTILNKLIEADARVLEDPVPSVHVEQLADSSVVLELRVWTDVGSYWDLLFDLRERAKADFETAGLSIPFPQQDIYVKAMPADKDFGTSASGDSRMPH